MLTKICLDLLNRKAGKNSQHGGMEPLFPLFSILTLIIFGKRQLSNAEVQCWAVWPDDSYWIPYMTVVAFLVYFIPLIIISLSGTKMKKPDSAGGPSGNTVDPGRT
ncbi:unnamed protein product [Lepidochelys olivacea]